MVTAFHRLAVWPHMCVSDDNAGHEEPLVAALYNNTFQVVTPSSLSTAVIPVTGILMPPHICIGLLTCLAMSVAHLSSVLCIGMVRVDHLAKPRITCCVTYSSMLDAPLHIHWL